MSLYRTWRPKSFADLVGQDAVVRTLTHAIETGKLAHAYLFSGPRGSGKTSAAKILARCIDCVNGPTAHPDNTCENCVAMLNGTALDVLEIDAASNRGIDEIRALRDAVKFAPSVMRMKVYIIDEAHMLTKEGANAFLKTLEEPPPHAVFILATTEPEKLPVTILSRCQRYAFRRISIPVMIERMREIARFEGISIDDDALATIAYRADGGLRDALTMLEQAAAFSEGTVTAQTIDLAFGATGRGYANELIDAVLARDAAATLRIVEEASDAGTDMPVLIRSLIAQFRNLLVARVDPELLARDLAPEDAERATQRAQGVAQATIVRALRVLSDAASLARTGGNPRLELETALLRFVLSSEDPTLDALSARLAALEEGTPVPARPPSGTLSKAPPSPSATASEAPPSPSATASEAPPSPSATASAAPPSPGATASEAPPSPSVTLSGARSAQSKGAPSEGSGAPAGRPAPVEKTPPALETASEAPPASAPASIAPPPSTTASEARSAQSKGNGGAVTVQKVRAAWSSIRGKAEHEKASLRMPLSGAMISDVEDGALVLKLRNKLELEILKDHSALLEKAIEDVLGSKLRLRLETGAGAAAANAPVEEEMPQFDEPSGDDADALFNYANERIRER